MFSVAAAVVVCLFVVVVVVFSFPILLLETFRLESRRDRARTTTRTSLTFSRVFANNSQPRKALFPSFTRYMKILAFDDLFSQ